VKRLRRFSACLKGQDLYILVFIAVLYNKFLSLSKFVYFNYEVIKLDILVTTPKSEIESSRKEGEAVQRDGGYWFRTFRFRPKVKPWDRIFFVENGLLFQSYKSNQSTIVNGDMPHSFIKRYSSLFS